MITNVHSRRVPARACDVRRALDSLGSATDHVWPANRWPALRLADGLRPGSRGGHGPIRYTVEEVTDRVIVFRFERPLLRGTHRFEVQPDGLACVVRHVLEARPTLRTRIAWTLAIRWLHDALIEDLLDNLVREVGAQVKRPARWSAYVRLLRRGYSSRSDAGRRDEKPVVIAPENVDVLAAA